MTAACQAHQSTTTRRRARAAPSCLLERGCCCLRRPRTCRWAMRCLRLRLDGRSCWQQRRRRRRLTSSLTGRAGRAARAALRTCPACAHAPIRDLARGRVLCPVLALAHAHDLFLALARVRGPAHGHDSCSCPSPCRFVRPGRPPGASVRRRRPCRCWSSSSCLGPCCCRT